jgi:predicted 3-demethylubiquinone-9 3-methyltransferase (glyoxalase superfamily)
MSKIKPCLPNSRIDAVMHYTVETPGGKPGDVMLVEFTLAGESYMALNGGPYYEFTPAVSLFVSCANQAEVDRLWDALSPGGSPLQCGWITDRYGVSWQIVPEALSIMMKDEDRSKVRRVMEAMLQMVKLDAGVLEAAYRGASAA